MKKNLISLAIAGALATGAGPALAQALPSTTFNAVGSIGALSMYQKQELPFWTETVPKESGGAVKVQVKPFTELGFKGPEIFRLVSAGTLQFATTVLNYNSGEVPMNEAGDLVGLVASVEELQKVLDVLRPAYAKFLEGKYGIKLRGFGSYSLRVADPIQLIRELSGSNPHFAVEQISEQLRNLITSRLADLLGDSRQPVLDLASRYDELAADLRSRLAAEWAGYGLELTTLLIENLTLPPEVEAALDRRTAIGLTGDLAAFRTYQEGIALEKAAANPGGSAAAGAGLAMGFGLGERLSPPPPPPPPPAEESEAP